VTLGGTQAEDAHHHKMLRWMRSKPAAICDANGLVGKGLSPPSRGWSRCRIQRRQDDRRRALALYFIAAS